MARMTGPGTGHGRAAAGRWGAAARAALVLAGVAAAGPVAGQAPQPGTVLSLATEPAAEYRTGEPLVGIDREVAAAAAEHLPGLEFSSNLARAARELAGSWTGTDIGAAPHELITFALHSAGCADPSAMAALVATTDSSSEPAWREFAATLGSVKEPFTHVGVAGARDPGRPRYTRWVMLVVDRRYTLRPLPRALAAGAAVRLEFGLPRALRNPGVIATTPHGATLRFAAEATADGWAATLALGRDPGEHTVEILASDEHGPQVVALFPISVGAPPPRQWRGEAPPAEDAIRSAATAEDYLRELTDRQRRDNGRKELVWDPRLAAVARRHAEDMRDHGFMGHLSRHQRRRRRPPAPRRLPVLLRRREHRPRQLAVGGGGVADAVPRPPRQPARHRPHPRRHRRRHRDRRGRQAHLPRHPGVRQARPRR